MFSKEWSPYVGDGKKVSQTSFQTYRNDVDRLYTCYAGLIGATPKDGSKVYVDIIDHANNIPAIFDFDGVNYIGYAGLDEFVWESLNDAGQLGYLRKPMTDTFVKNIDPKKNNSLNDLFQSYTFEHNGLNPYKGKSKDWYRKSVYDKSVKEFNKGKLDAFKESEHEVCAYDMYLLGLVDKVGWDTYEKALRSYKTRGYQSKSYSGDSSVVAARDLLDRIEFYSGKKDVLRSLPDKGKLLDLHFAPSERK